MSKVKVKYSERINMLICTNKTLYNGRSLIKSKLVLGWQICVTYDIIIHVWCNRSLELEFPNLICEIFGSNYFITIIRRIVLIFVVGRGKARIRRYNPNRARRELMKFYEYWAYLSCHRFSNESMLEKIAVWTKQERVYQILKEVIW